MTTITRELIAAYLNGEVKTLTNSEQKELARIALASLEDEIKLLPVGVMSESAFYRLERSESRFIALWPRPGIFLPRPRPDDGVIVYAKVEGA
ncbi:hypothetical protein [Escherichia coli]|uniref:hypothetical protein n=1 Tax=Escherichia coli TaxID=562 RepID=UPI0006938CAF|nr:hypothetical protein [Escherichia coli]MCA7114607.1 hypothetical protein [Escherichia coli]MCA7480880.1 hypothetical protein [Escherichia coli]MCA7834495.1 hypothetical protein [Escherichia coli]MCF1528435.1 hypothetical protein [Escherichia coli]MCF3330638.1 hypothetical protein [Escherichia coli]